MLIFEVIEAFRGQNLLSEAKSMKEFIFWKNFLIKVAQWPEQIQSDLRYDLILAILIPINLHYQIVLYPYIHAMQHYIATAQSHYREVGRWEIFIKKYLRFGLVLGRLAILKNKLGRLWATFESGFFMFSGVKKV